MYLRYDLIKLKIKICYFLFLSILLFYFFSALLFFSFKKLLIVLFSNHFIGISKIRRDIAIQRRIKNGFQLVFSFVALNFCRSLRSRSVFSNACNTALHDRVLGPHSSSLSDDKLFVFTYVIPAQSSFLSSTSLLDVPRVHAQPGSLTDQ